jgi:hypothetical protein
VNNPDLTDSIVQRLSKGEARSDIIKEICENTGCTWREIEKLVDNLTVENEDAITRRRSPILFAIALFFFIAGFGLAIYAGFFVWRVLTSLSVDQADLLANIGSIAYLANYAPGVLFIGFTGAAMIAGSLVGIKQVWRALLGL